MNTQAILRTLLFTPGSKHRWGLPAIFEGKPGVGKTQVAEATGARYGMHVEVIIGSIREPTDVGGLARLEEDHFRLVPASWAIKLAELKHAILFLDELNTNVPAMQAALLRLATDGAVGEFVLPPTVRIIAAQNSVQDAAGGWDLAPPLANRFGHFSWGVPDASQWCQWMLSSAADEDVKVEKASDIEAKVMKVWDMAFARAKGIVTGFIKARPGLLHAMPTVGPEASRAWPSPRTWEMATRALAGAEVHGLERSDTEELMTGFIGVGAMGELLQYRERADLPDPADVLDGKVPFKHDAKRLDRTVAVLNACAAVVAPDKAPKRKERADALWKMIDTISKDQADLCIQAAVTLAKKGFTTTKEAYAALARLQPVLQAAGFYHKEG